MTVDPRFYRWYPISNRENYTESWISIKSPNTMATDATWAVRSDLATFTAHVRPLSRISQRLYIFKRWLFKAFLLTLTKWRAIPTPATPHREMLHFSRRFKGNQHNHLTN
ncbi:hypothetical protein HYFRA_00009177 [Hymenoscyphus fraxineus]|uniref:Uncharacterized protein n=1 Tax=Hymenoscyphus fraxineus TaxID=746836 RepID=A0A9N9KUD2_9HELO|nr:hypothetical protein HYFRA_00009177 [Hymenoscyphus fraxineus]